MKNKDVIEKITELENKYFDLVWYSRKDKYKLLEEERYDILKLTTDVFNKYPEECKRLEEEGGDWEHGFNSGMLAATRLFLGLMNRSKMENDCAIEDFPFLDT